MIPSLAVFALGAEGKVKAALSLTLILALMTSALMVTTQAQVKGPGVFELRGSAPMAGPLARAMTREAVRLAAEDLTPSAVDGVRQGGKSRCSDWSRVRGLEGEEIILTVYGSLPGKRYVVRATVDEFGLTVLNLTDPAIPAAATNVLADAAWWHADYFGKAQKGGSFRLNKHVRLAAGGVFVDDRKVVELEQVVEPVARNSVAEISLVHTAIKRGIGWGALIGGVTGLAIVMGQCGTHWNQETSSCGNLTGLWLFLGPGMGIGIGSGIGATFKISTVVYRAP